MSQDSYYQQPAAKPAQGAPAKAANGTWRWLAPSLALTAIGLVALASCGPDNGPGATAASNSAPSAGANAASASVLAAGPAPAPAAPACPKLVEPKCPAAPSVAKPLSAHTAAIWSGAHRRGWRRHGHRFAYAEAARRWDQGRPWPGDRPDGERYDHHGDGLMGGLAMDRGGYRIGEESRFSERSDSSRFESGERVIERDREEVRGLRPCPLDCRGGLPGDWRGGGYRAAGIDARGYLVWPGKVEY